MSLQRPEAGDRVVDAPGGLPGVGQRWQRRGQRPLVVVGVNLIDEPANGGGPVTDRVRATAADQLPDLELDRVDRGNAKPLTS